MPKKIINVRKSKPFKLYGKTVVKKAHTRNIEAKKKTVITYPGKLKEDDKRELMVKLKKAEQIFNDASSEYSKSYWQGHVHALKDILEEGKDPEILLEQTKKKMDSFSEEDKNTAYAVYHQGRLHALIETKVEKDKKDIDVKKEIVKPKVKSKLKTPSKVDIEKDMISIKQEISDIDERIEYLNSPNAYKLYTEKHGEEGLEIMVKAVDILSNERNDLAKDLEWKKANVEFKKRGLERTGTHDKMIMMNLKRGKTIDWMIKNTDIFEDDN